MDKANLLQGEIPNKGMYLCNSATVFETMQQEKSSHFFPRSSWEHDSSDKLKKSSLTELSILNYKIIYTQNHTPFKCIKSFIAVNANLKERQLIFST